MWLVALGKPELWLTNKLHISTLMTSIIDTIYMYLFLCYELPKSEENASKTPNFKRIGECGIKDLF
jgi:hypothetical protein